MLTVLRPFKIEHVELTVGFEEAPDRTQRLGLLVSRRMVKHERGKHMRFDRQWRAQSNALWNRNTLRVSRTIPSTAIASSCGARIAKPTPFR